MVLRQIAKVQNILFQQIKSTCSLKIEVDGVWLPTDTPSIAVSTYDYHNTNILHAHSTVIDLLIANTTTKLTQFYSHLLMIGPLLHPFSIRCFYSIDMDPTLKGSLSSPLARWLQHWMPFSPTMPLLLLLDLLPHPSMLIVGIQTAAQY